MRTHFCGELTKDNLNNEIKLCGWVNRRRDHGGVIFLDLRDKKGIAQVVINPETAETFKIAETNYEIASEKHNRGVINSFVLRDIEITYINSGISLQQAAYNLMESKISLLKISGGIIQDFSN